jgi:hypothetical protein
VHCVGKCIVLEAPICVVPICWVLKNVAKIIGLKWIIIFFLLRACACAHTKKCASNGDERGWGDIYTHRPVPRRAALAMRMRAPSRALFWPARVIQNTVDS